MRVLCNALFAVSVCAAPLWAEEPVRISVPPTNYLSAIGQTWVEIRDTDEPGAVAEIEFSNAPINGSADNRTYSMEWDGTVTQVRFTWNAGPGGADAIEIIPPPGHACLPECYALVQEGGQKVIYIFPAMS